MISGWFVIGFLPVLWVSIFNKTRTTRSRRYFSKSTVMQLYQHIAYYGPIVVGINTHVVQNVLIVGFII